MIGLSLLSTLPVAVATGNMTLKANAVVERLVYDLQIHKAPAIEVIDSQTRQRTRYSAKLFFMCASTIGGMGIFLDNMDSYYYGNRPNNIYIPRFRNLPGSEDQTDYVRGFGYQGIPVRSGWSMSFDQQGFRC